jgi:mannose-6-phosphate isomerase-like protein (cupin superfamily)
MLRRIFSRTHDSIPHSRSFMARFIDAPVSVAAGGSPGKTIKEFVGREATGQTQVSVARMQAPAGWKELGQRPEFSEITVVLSGMLRVEHEAGKFDVRAGQAVITDRGEWVRYSTPEPEGAEYVAICIPAFSMATAHRDG